MVLWSELLRAHNMYKVVKMFTDLQDGDWMYEVGDTFPRSGTKVHPRRIAELLGENNKQGVPLIKQIEEKKITR